MPRRQKARLYDLITYIVQLHEKEGLDFKSIEARLRAEGYDISKSSIHRAYKSYAEAARDYNRMFEEVKVLLEAFKEKPVQYQLEAITGIIASHLLKFVKDIEALEFEDPEALALTIQRLTQSIEKLTKFREEKLKQIIEEASKENTTKEDLLKMLKEVYGA